MDTDHEPPGEHAEDQPARHGAEHLAEHRWPKGVSGNKAGRPPNRKTLLQTMQEALDKPAPAEWQGKNISMAGETVRDVLARRTVQAAAIDPRNSSAARILLAIMDREDPKNTRLTIEDGTVAGLAQACVAIEAGDNEALKEALGVTGEG